MLSIGIGNVLMVIRALAMTPLLLKLTQVPYPFIAATLFPLMLLAAYQSRFNMADIYVVLAMGVLGARDEMARLAASPRSSSPSSWDRESSRMHGPPSRWAMAVLIFFTRPFTLGILHPWLP